MPDLQVSVDALTGTGALSRHSCSINQTILNTINTSLSASLKLSPESHHACQFDAQDLEKLAMFQTRTVLTLGTAKSALVYQKEVVRLACLVSFYFAQATTETDVV